MRTTRKAGIMSGKFYTWKRFILDVSSDVEIDNENYYGGTDYSITPEGTFEINATERVRNWSPSLYTHTSITEEGYVTDLDRIYYVTSVSGNKLITDEITTISRGSVSSTDRNAYPENGIQDDYYYVLLNLDR